VKKQRDNPCQPTGTLFFPEECDCVACVGIQVRQQPWQLQPAKSPLWAKLCVTLQGSLRKKAHVVSKQGFEQEAASGALG
tara:strand:+ start:1077 stop:1316 length:240 start_codon:yes stop_codon:yes gene_type:complete